MACFHLISIKNPQTGKYVQVPCGHCIGCLQDMQQDWVTRLTHELKTDLSRPAVFVTLTYNEDNLPTDEVNEDTGEVFRKPCVVKKHVQQFMKSLRLNIDRKKKRGQWKGYDGPLKYFFTSEYGPNGGRPHYHGIIFGLSKKDIKLFEQLWNKGFVHVGEANEKTITYCAKYCIKPTEFSKHPDRKGYFDNEKWMEDNGIRRKPFRLMSTKLGHGYIQPSTLKFHLRDPFKNNYMRLGKFKRKMPRYYKDRIYTSLNEKKYGNTNYGDTLIGLIGNYQYWRNLTNAREKYALSEDYIRRDLEDAQQREHLLIQNRRKWFKREQRNHRQ